MNGETEDHELTADEKKLFEDLMPEDLNEIMDTGFTRRHFLKLMSIAGTGMLAAHLLGTEQWPTHRATVPKWETKEGKI